MVDKLDMKISFLTFYSKYNYVSGLGQYLNQFTNQTNLFDVKN